MQTRRTIGSEWKTLLALGFFVVLLAFCTHELYRAWVFGTVGPRLMSVSVDANPILFAAAVLLFAIGSIVTAAVVVGGLCALRSERRFLRRRESRPPLDDARRAPFDRRP
jgi:hypothetical protein